MNDIDIKKKANQIKHKLIKKMQAKSEMIQQVIMRYIFERFLYRMTVSQYADNFILRGSMLLYVYTGPKARYTKDIDYMGFSISNNHENIRKVFEDICSIQCPEDCIVFLPETIKIETINTKKTYPGCRVSISVLFGDVKERIKFDIGFDDVITPGKKLYKYPLILDGVPGFELYGYTIETSLAEKIHTIIDKADITTRMKDFYDIWFIMNNIEINYDTLDEAITNTFNHRKTRRTSDSEVFGIEYYLNTDRLNEWSRFIKNAKIDYVPFIEIGKFIIEKVKPLL